jgi:Protein of unknown function (DUF669)
MATTSLADLIRNVDPSKDTFSLLPTGDYEAIVWEVELTKSSNKNPMFRLKFKVTEGEFEKRQLFHQVTITENNAAIAVRQLLACGAESQDAIADALVNAPALDFCKTLVDTPVVITVEIDDGSNYDNKERNKIKNIRAGKAPAKDDSDALSGGKKAEKKAEGKPSARPSTPF